MRNHTRSLIYMFGEMVVCRYTQPYQIIEKIWPFFFLEKGPKFCNRYLIIAKFWSAHTARVTPVPIPNTVVKPRRADGSVFVRIC